MKSPVLLVVFLVIAAAVGLTIGRYGETVYNHFNNEATTEVKSTTQPEINKFISYNDLPLGASRVRSLGRDWFSFELRLPGSDETMIYLYHRGNSGESLTVAGQSE